MGWKLVALAAALVLVVAGAVVLVTAKGPDEQLSRSGAEPLPQLPRPERAVGPVRVVVSCPALFGKSTAGVFAPKCQLLQLWAVARTCARGAESVDLVVLLTGPDGRPVNGTDEAVPCSQVQLVHVNA